MLMFDDFRAQGQLSFASYAALDAGVPNVRALVDSGMSELQAAMFASEWLIVDQYNLADGQSATVFQSTNDGRRSLSVRGTETRPIWTAISDLSADYLLAVGLPNNTILQYIELRDKVHQWLSDGTLRSGFTASGHSLGGYLAGAIGLAFPNDVSAIYTYNAPGVGGLVGGGAYQFLKSVLGLENVPILPNTYNLRGAKGLSLIAGLGAQLSPPISVEIEGAPGLGLDNHIIARISDSLSVYSLLSQLGQNLSFRQVSELIAASSIRDADTLEMVLFPVLDALGMAPVGLENRDELFIAISNLQGEAAQSQSFLTIQSLVGMSASELFELASGQEGGAYRRALRGLDSYAILGDGVEGSEFANHEGEVGPTDLYLADRSEMLFWKNQWFMKDGAALLSGEDAESRRFFGSSLNNISADPIAFTVRGRRIESIGIPVLRSFGSDSDDSFVGSDTLAGDHFYGGSGNDSLDGQGGADYLEGNSGDDTLRGGFDDDVLVGGAGFDSYVYNEGDDFDTITDSDGSGEIIYNGRVLAGGTEIGEEVYRDAFGVEYVLLEDGAGRHFLLVDGNLLVEEFENGDLGILVDGEASPPESPESSAAHFYFDSFHPQDYDPHDGSAYGGLLNLYGSQSDDSFQTSGVIDVFGRTGNDVAVVGAVTYSNTIDLGAGDDVIDASGSTGALGSSTLAGGGGSDSILGGSGADTIWGDNYRAISLELASGATPRSLGTYRIDGLNYNAALEAGESVLGFLPAGYGIYAATTDAVVLRDATSKEVADAVMVPNGSMIAGSLEEVLLAVVGESSAFDDYIEAGDGNDFVIGGSGADRILGGTGSDFLVGDYGAGSINTPSYRALQTGFGQLAALFGNPGDDILDGGDGDDHLVDTDGGNEILSGGPGGDVIESREDYWRPDADPAARNAIHGDEGDDSIYLANATGGMDVVDGGEGDDVIDVRVSRWSADEDGDGQADVFGTSEGRALVIGGAGDDVLLVFADDGIVEGGAGDDDYTVSGERITISDSGGEDTLHLGMFDLSYVDASTETFPTLDPEDEAELDASDQFSSTVVLREGNDLLVVNRFAHDGLPVSEGLLRIDGWFGSSDGRIERIVYDGAEELSLTPAQLETWGGLHQGGGGADELVYASEYSDRAFGGGGDDLIFTGNGADRISGGKGDDELLGGAGNDTYYYADGDGHDSIEETSGFDEIRFGPGFLAADVNAALGDSGLVLTVASGQIDVAGATRSDPGVEQLRFADGTTVSVADLLGLDPEPPEVVEPGPSDGEATGGPPLVEGLQIEASPRLGPVAIPAGSVSTSEFSEGPVPPASPGLLLQTPPLMGLGSVGEVDSTMPVDQEDAPLDMATLLRAVQAFEAAPESSPGIGSAGLERAGAPADTPVLSSWALTNALLAFHLGRTDAGSDTDGVGDAFVPAGFLPGIGVGGAMSGAFPSFGEASQRLQTFSGLQEGLARLG